MALKLASINYDQNILKNSKKIIDNYNNDISLIE